MGYVWIDGCEVGDLSAAVLVVGGFTNQTSVKRTGSYAYKADTSNASSAYALFSLDMDANSATDVWGDPKEAGFATGFNLNTAGLRAYIRFTSFPATECGILAPVDLGGSPIEWVTVTSGGTLNLAFLGITGSTVLSLNTFYRIELLINVTTQAYSLKIDGVTELSGTQSEGSYNAPVAGIVLGDVLQQDTSGTTVMYFDDIALDNTALPGTGTSWCGRPDGDGTYTDFTIGAGSGAEWQQIDEVPPDGLTTYLLTLAATAPDTQTVTLESATSGGVSSTIHAVKVNVTVAPSTGTDTVQIRVRLGSTDYDTGNMVISGNAVFRTLSRVMSKRPSDNGAWTLSDIDGMEAGVEAVAENVALAFTAISIEVDYEPSVGPTLLFVTGSITPTGALIKKPGVFETGSITPTGALIKKPGKFPAGSITPIGTIIKNVGAHQVGSITPTGAVIKKPGKFFVGSITPTGALAVARVVLLFVTGSIASTGSLIKTAGKALAGSITPTGALRKSVAKYFTGSITPTSTMATIKVVLLFVVGSITPSGLLIRQPGKRLDGSITPTGTIARWSVSKLLAGSITPTGAVLKGPSKFFSGSITPTGAVTLARQAFLFLTGLIGMSGALIKKPTAYMTGSITPTGSLTVSRLLHVFLTGSIAMSGTLAKTVGKTFAGSIAMSGAIIKRIGKLFAGLLGMSGSLTKTGGTPVTGQVNAASLTISNPGITDLTLTGRPTIGEMTIDE